MVGNRNYEFFFRTILIKIYTTVVLSSSVYAHERTEPNSIDPNGIKSNSKRTLSELIANSYRTFRGRFLKRLNKFLKSFGVIL